MSVWMSKAEKVSYVKRQRQSRPHTCHWPGCGRQVPPALWGCSDHWSQLPHDLRGRIWSTYRPGQENTLSPSREYLAVCRDVEKFFQDAGIITLKNAKIVGEKSHDSKSTGEKKMNATLHLEGTRQKVLEQIDEFRLVIASSLKTQPSARGKKPKDEDVEEEDEDEEESDAEDSEEEDEDEEEETSEDEDEEESEEDDEEEESSGKAPKKEAVVKALKTYAAKGAKFKDKAMAALGSFKSAAGKKVKHVDDMQKSDYAKLLKKLK